MTLVEKRPDVGRGIAYSTANPDHLLNVRAANMSAFPDDPGHFWNWLNARREALGGLPTCPDPFRFVPRQVYGNYIRQPADAVTGRGLGRKAAQDRAG